MNPTFLNILRIKLSGWYSNVRMLYYKKLGLRYGADCKIGKIICNWPNNVVIGNKCVVLDHVNFGIGYGFDKMKTITVGNNVFIGYGVEFNCTNSINIGNNVLIATGTKIVDVGHTYEMGKRIDEQPLKSLPIKIEDDVWIAANCVIVGGVTISRGSVIAAGSVVTKSIPANEIWGGVPAKLIKARN